MSGETNGESAGSEDEPRSVIVEAMVPCCDFSEAEIEALRDLERRPQTVSRGTELAMPGQRGSRPFVILDGYVTEYRQDGEGRRQALDLRLPGEIANLQSVILDQTDDYLVASTDAVIAPFTITNFHELVSRHPRLGAILVWRTAVRRSLLAEHLLDVGRRSGYERLCHRILELLVRMERGGLSYDNRLAAHFSLSTIADMVGLSPEHTSRVLSQMRRDGLIGVEDGIIEVLDRERMIEIAGFDPIYLHMDGWPPVVERQYR